MIEDVDEISHNGLIDRLSKFAPALPSNDTGRIEQLMNNLTPIACFELIMTLP